VPSAAIIPVGEAEQQQEAPPQQQPQQQQAHQQARPASAAALKTALKQRWQWAASSRRPQRQTLQGAPRGSDLDGDAQDGAPRGSDLDENAQYGAPRGSDLEGSAAMWPFLSSGAALERVPVIGYLPSPRHDDASGGFVHIHTASGGFVLVLGDSSCLDDDAQDGATRSAIGAGAGAAAKAKAVVAEAAECRFVLTEVLRAALRLDDSSSSSSSAAAAAAATATATASTSSSPAPATASTRRATILGRASALSSAVVGTRALPLVFRHAERLTHAFADRALSSGGAADAGAPSLTAAQLGAFHSQSRVWALQRACVVTGLECTLPLVPPPVWTHADAPVTAPEQLASLGGVVATWVVTWRGQPPSSASTGQLLALGMALGLGASALLAVRGRRRLRTRRRAAGMEARSV
jgi:hypothetical protein